ncbi:hypothetical protein Emag_001165 [Eimeria magna]
MVTGGFVPNLSSEELDLEDDPTFSETQLYWHFLRDELRPTPQGIRQALFTASLVTVVLLLFNILKKKEEEVSNSGASRVEPCCMQLEMDLVIIKEGWRQAAVISCDAFNCEATHYQGVIAKVTVSGCEVCSLCWRAAEESPEGEVATTYEKTSYEPPKFGSLSQPASPEQPAQEEATESESGKYRDSQKEEGGFTGEEVVGEELLQTSEKDGRLAPGIEGEAGEETAETGEEATTEIEQEEEKELLGGEADQETGGLEGKEEKEEEAEEKQQVAGQAPVYEEAASRAAEVVEDAQTPPTEKEEIRVSGEDAAWLEEEFPVVPEPEHPAGERMEILLQHERPAPAVTPLEPVREARKLEVEEEEPAEPSSVRAPQERVSD